MVVLSSEDGVIDLRFTIYDLRLITSVEQRTTRAMPVWFAPRASPFPRPSPLGRRRIFCCLSTKLGAVSARRASRIIEPAADCSLPMKLNVGQAFQPAGLPDFPVRWTKDGRLESRPNPQAGTPALRARPSSGAQGAHTVRRARVRGIGLPLNTATRTFPAIVELCESSGKAGGFV
jgi:hypothetical protein